MAQAGLSDAPEEDELERGLATLRRGAHMQRWGLLALSLSVLMVFGLLSYFVGFVEDVQQSQRLDADDDRYLVRVERDRIDRLTASTDGGSDTLTWELTGETWSATARVIVDVEIAACEASGPPIANLFAANDVDYTIGIAGEEQGQRVDCNEGEVYTHTFAGDTFNLTELKVDLDHTNPDNGNNRLTFKVSVHWIEVEWITESEAMPSVGAVAVAAVLVGAALARGRRQ